MVSVSGSANIAIVGLSTTNKLSFRVSFVNLTSAMLDLLASMSKFGNYLAVVCIDGLGLKTSYKFTGLVVVNNLIVTPSVNIVSIPKSFYVALYGNPSPDTQGLTFQLDVTTVIT